MRASNRQTSGAPEVQASAATTSPEQAGLTHSLGISWLLSTGYGALFALALPPFDLWFLAPLAPVPLAWMSINAPRARRVVFVTFATSLALWLWLLRWIVPVTAVGYPFLAVYLSAFTVSLAWILHRVGRHARLGSWPMTVVLPVVWTGLEFLRGDLVFNGYPWYLLAHPLIELPVLVQSADLLGTYFVSFLAAAVSGMLIDWVAIADLRRVPLRARELKRRIAFASGMALILLVKLGYGVWRINQTGTLSTGPTILAMQTNLPQDNKTGWSIEEQSRDIPGFIESSRQAFNQTSPKPDLIAWPETMVPGIGFEPQTLEHLKLLGPGLEHLATWPDAVSALSRELNTPIVVGSESWVDTSIEVDEAKSIARLKPGSIYNSAYLVWGNRPYQRYDKYFLTPFGETMPYISNWPWLERQLLTLGVGANLSFNLDSNPDVRLLGLDWRGGRAILATPICFEDTVARYCRRMVHANGTKQTSVFVNLSNDGWFSFSNADRKLHAQIARFRCIENRVPMIRSVNTGLSVAIDSCGRLVASTSGEGYGVGQHSGWVAATMALDSRRTLYGRVGELWGWLCLGLTAAGLTWTYLEGRDKSKEGVT
ncbi:MAG: apolipoprotein N-acyltransferase [Phycisphaerales bacterium]|nr:apolipoprotein N-acyltransferase [Phycisphaerales bacterium]MCI0674294.1 apolipoprotein N-acyltransferase [Phycisphaerales bacterium]